MNENENLCFKASQSAAPLEKRQNYICLRISPLEFGIISNISSVREKTSVCWSGLRRINRGSIWSFTQCLFPHCAKVNQLIKREHAT